VAAGILSGVPSTLWALVTGADPWEATRAAGVVVVGEQAGWGTILAAATVVHGAMSAFWSCVLCAVLPRRHAALWGAAAGALIAVVDIAVIGRMLPGIRDLAFGPQLADHLAFGGVVGAVMRLCDKYIHV
jgi:hypothetical protein